MVNNEIRRVVVHSQTDVRIEFVPDPVAGPGEVVVEPSIVGICGSDVHAARGMHPFIELPYRPGHEVTGTVVELGPAVDDSWADVRVVVEPNLACGRCELCINERYNICEGLKVFGCQTPGGLADRFVIPIDRLHRLPDDLDDHAAVLVEPLSTPVRAVRSAGDLSGRRVTVIGLGPIGLFTQLAALRAGAASVATFDPIASKRQRSERLGAVAAIDPTDPSANERAVSALGGPCHVVLDCVSNESTLRQGIALLQKGGRLVVVGVASGDVAVPMNLVQDRELEVCGSLMFVRQDMEAAIDLLRGDVVPADGLVDAGFGLDEVAAAFAAAADPERFKVAVRVSS